MGGAGGDKPRSLLLNSGWNKIGDRGCRHINGGGWLQVKVVHMSIQNILGDCGIREEGCRAMAKRKERLERISCILLVTQVITTK